MLDHEFLDKWDMSRRIEARLFCFGSGDSDEPSGGGSARNDNNDRDPAQRVASVVGLNPTLVEMAQSATPAQRAANAAKNDRIFNEFIANDIMNQRMDAATSPRVQVFDMNDSAGDYLLNPSLSRSRPADISVASTNLPPATINDFGVTFDTETGNIIGSDASYFGDLSQSPAGMVPLNSAPVPTPPPPRYQTNAERDFYENLAAQGDLAMNRFRSEVRNLNNRGLLGNFIASGIGNRGVPNFNPDMPQGYQIRGVTNTKFVDLPFVGTVPVSTYTGLDNPNAVQNSDERAVEPEINPMTDKPRCPDGYVFDEDLQACRLDASASVDQAAAPDGEIFFRRTSLDDAPANTPSGFDFDAANTRFVQSYGSRPDFYRSPMSLTGFTRLT